MYQHPEAFRLHGVASEGDYSAHRWTVDTPEDLEFVRQVYDRFANEDTFAWTEVLDLIDREPRLADINRHVRQKALELG
jgi:spore coat polysaccharide biosynthesis protein SpsF